MADAIGKFLGRAVAKPLTLILLLAWIIVVAIELQFIKADPLKDLQSHDNEHIKKTATYLKSIIACVPSIISAAIICLLKPAIENYLATGAIIVVCVLSKVSLNFHIFLAICMFLYFALNNSRHKVLLLTAACAFAYVFQFTKP
jgi:hypothetical protein